MKLGIVGKPQSGKTTVFNAACGMHEAVGHYDQAIHRAVIKVPDNRLEELSKIFNPKKTTHAEIEILDAPGLSGKGKESGGIEISQELKQMDALMAVIDDFSPDARPEKDLQDLFDEMILHDHAIVESNIHKNEKKQQLTGDKVLGATLAVLKKCLPVLEKEQPLIDLSLDENESKLIRNFTFMSLKPMLIVINISEDKLKESDKIYSQFSKFFKPNKREVAVVCGSVEMELVGISGEDKKAFLDELGITTPAVELVIQKSYNLLGLQSFFTCGEPEVRAWTIKKGTNAHKAAGAIHSDIERGFIRAEVVKYEDQIAFQTHAALKAHGKQRLEGKEYIVQDGDIILFRFNV
jgi:GTP-binding protein YchF